MKTTWLVLLKEALRENGEEFHDIFSCAPALSKLSEPFDDDYGSSEGCPFTVWTEKRVYFPAVYAGMEWVASVSRHPDGIPTNHIGGQ